MEDEGQAVGSVAQATGMSKAKAEGGFEAGGKGLFFGEPNGSDAVGSRGGQAESLAGNYGVSDEMETLGRTKVREVRGSARRA